MTSVKAWGLFQAVNTFPGSTHALRSWENVTLPPAFGLLISHLRNILTKCVEIIEVKSAWSQAHKSISFLTNIYFTGTTT